MPLNKAIERLRSDLAVSLVRTFSARALAALGALGLLLVVGRNYGPTGVGLLALSQSVLLGAGLLSKGGMDNALMRYVGQDPSVSEVLRYLGWALRRGLLMAVCVCIVILLLRNRFESVFAAPGLADMLLGVGMAIPAYVFAYLLSGFFKGVRMSATACLMENGVIALLAGGFLWIWGHLGDELVSLAVIGYVYFLAAMVVALQGVIQLWLWCRKQPWYLMGQENAASSSDSLVSVEQFRSTSRAFFAMTFAAFMQKVLAVMMAGWLLSSADLGLFKTSQEIGMVIAFILLVMNAIFPPRFAALFYNDDLMGLSRLARVGALLGGVVALPPVLICLVFPEWVLSWFGDGFAEAVWLLRIIAVAQLVNVATGSVGFLLNMTGHEKLMRNIALICNALGLTGFFVLISLFGPLGAALALAFVLLCQNLVALYYVWRRLGIWTLPVPNLFLLLGVKSQNANLAG